MYQGIGEFDLNQLIAKRLTTPGGASAPSVAPELFPVLTLESDRPEWGWLKAENYWGGYVAHGASANQNHAYLTNPAGSKTIAVVKRVTALCSAGQISLYLAPVGTIGTPVTIQAGVARDGRNSVFSGGVFTRRSTCLMQFVDRGIGAEPDIVRSLTTSIDFTDPIIVTPGTYLIIVSRTATATLQYGVQWTERPAQIGELV